MFGIFTMPHITNLPLLQLSQVQRDRKVSATIQVPCVCNGKPNCCAISKGQMSSSARFVGCNRSNSTESQQITAQQCLVSGHILQTQLIHFALQFKAIKMLVSQILAVSTRLWQAASPTPPKRKDQAKQAPRIVCRRQEPLPYLNECTHLLTCTLGIN